MFAEYGNPFFQPREAALVGGLAHPACPTQPSLDGLGRVAPCVDAAAVAALVGASNPAFGNARVP